MVSEAKFHIPGILIVEATLLKVVSSPRQVLWPMQSFGAWALHLMLPSSSQQLADGEETIRKVPLFFTHLSLYQALKLTFRW